MRSGILPPCPEALEGEAVRVNSFALVSYIPNPMGEYLDKMRRELVPGCHLRSHVSVLPPRPVQDEDTAQAQIREQLLNTNPFVVEAGKVTVFESTNVIYLEVRAGKAQLEALHNTLNSGALEYREPFLYHPHITLAQDFPPGQLDEMKWKAERSWSEFVSAREFPLETLWWVQGVSQKRWLDLKDWHLNGTGKR